MNPIHAFRRLGRALESFFNFPASAAKSATTAADIYQQARPIMSNLTETNAALKFERWLASHPPPPVVLDAPKRPACFQLRPRRSALPDQPVATVINLPHVAYFAWPVFTAG